VALGLLTVFDKAVRSEVDSNVLMANAWRGLWCCCYVGTRKGGFFPPTSAEKTFLLLAALDVGTGKVHPRILLVRGLYQSAARFDHYRSWSNDFRLGERLGGRVLGLVTPMPEEALRMV